MINLKYVRKSIDPATAVYYDKQEINVYIIKQKYPSVYNSLERITYQLSVNYVNFFKRKTHTCSPNKIIFPELLVIL